jgi:tryptophan synthase alpha chain
MPFITAGDPDLETTRALILEMERRGADIIELGIPFSDPIADGPTIQSSFTRALAGGTTARAALAMVGQLRKGSQIPIVAMVSYSVVGKIGVSVFTHLAARAGVDGMIVPDLPVEEASDLIREARALDLCTIFLAAPTTPPERARLIVKHSTGFIYYISVTGTTGARASLPADMREKIAALKSLTDKPVALGFGVSTPEQAAVVGKVADGVIVGSAIMKKIAECSRLSRKELLRHVGDLTEALAKGAKGT